MSYGSLTGTLRLFDTARVSGVKVLVVEDDDGIRTVLGGMLADDGHEPVMAESAEEALVELGRGLPDLMLVDLTLGAMDGMAFIAHARSLTQAPIVVVSARDDPTAVIAALEAGADDYVAKPFDLGILSARCRAVLRRSWTEPPDGQLVLDAGRRLVLEQAAGDVFADGSPVHLTATEFRLLCELATDAGRVVSRGRLLDRVWERDVFFDERLVDVHIRRLRLKVERDPDAPQLVVTVRGQGYRLDLG